MRAGGIKWIMKGGQNTNYNLQCVSKGELKFKARRRRKNGGIEV